MNKCDVCGKETGDKTAKVYSDTGEFIDMRFGIAKEKIIGNYKIAENDDGSSSFIYIGRDD